MTYHVEVSDDYIEELEAEDDAAAKAFADRTAVQHGPLVEVLLFRGPIVSGRAPFYAARTDGSGNLR